MQSEIVLKVYTKNESYLLTAEKGENLRALLIRQNFSPHSGIYKTINCHGLGICGSCKIKIRESDSYWVRRSCQIRCFQSMEIALE